MHSYAMEHSLLESTATTTFITQFSLDKGVDTMLCYHRSIMCIPNQHFYGHRVYEEGLKFCLYSMAMVLNPIYTTPLLQLNFWNSSSMAYTPAWTTYKNFGARGTFEALAGRYACVSAIKSSSLRYAASSSGLPSSGTQILLEPHNKFNGMLMRI